MGKVKKDKWLGAFIVKVNQDCIGAFSAQAAFFIIISFFPFLMLLLAMSTMFNISDPILHYFSVDVMPKDVQNLINNIVEEVKFGGTGGMVWATIALTIWSASKGVMALMTGLNFIYGIPETRNYIYLRILSMIYTLLFSFALTVVIVLLVFGRTIYHWLVVDFPWLRDILTHIISIRMVIVFVMLVLLFWVLFIFMPKRRPKVFAELPGAFLAACGWIAFSSMFSYYIENIGNYSYLYGSLAAIVLFMVWLWICMFIFFMGGEINLLFQGNCRLKLVCEDETGRKSYGEEYRVIHSPFVVFRRNRKAKKLYRAERRVEKSIKNSYEICETSETPEMSVKKIEDKESGDE